MCFSEAEYAFQEKKEVVALLMEQDYKPNGWLAILVGNGLSYDFSGKYRFEAKCEELLKRIDVLYGVDMSGTNDVRQYIRGLYLVVKHIETDKVILLGQNFRCHRYLFHSVYYSKCLMYSFLKA